MYLGCHFEWQDRSKCEWQSVDIPKVKHVLWLGNYDKLDGNTKKCYDKKLDLIGVNTDDPNTLAPSELHLNKWPVIDCLDIYNYLIITPLQPWIVGRNLCAHCTCMAGLGMVCSHIAALFFCCRSINTNEEKVVCTSYLCMWLSPTMQNISYAEITEIDFSQLKQIEGEWYIEIHHNKLVNPKGIVKYASHKTDGFSLSFSALWSS